VLVRGELRLEVRDGVDFTAQRSPTQEPGLGEEMQTPTPAMSRNRNQDLDSNRLLADSATSLLTLRSPA
jgi:hypothetical protein